MTEEERIKRLTQKQLETTRGALWMALSRKLLGKEQENIILETWDNMVWEDLELAPPEPLTLAWKLLHERIDQLEAENKRLSEAKKE